MSVVQPSIIDIIEAVDGAVAASFPDGDPIDHLLPFMKQHGMMMDDIDSALKAHNVKSKGLYGDLADTWHHAQEDAMHDAEHVEPEQGNAFYNVHNGMAVANRNPWR